MVLLFIGPALWLTMLRQGIAFCEYLDPAATEVAIKALDNMELGENHLRVRKASIGITQVAGVEMGVNAMSMLAGTTSTDSEVTRILQLLNMVTPEELMDNDDYEGMSKINTRWTLKRPTGVTLIILQRFVTMCGRSALNTGRLLKSRFHDRLAAVDSRPEWERFSSNMTPRSRLRKPSRPWLAGSSPIGLWLRPTSPRRTSKWVLGRKTKRAHVGWA